MCVAEEVFGEGDHIGVLVRDRFPGYDNSFKGEQQYCFEHLKRDCKELLGKEPQNAEYQKFVQWAENRSAPAENNMSERGVRRTVIARKVCGGSQSKDALMVREVLQSVIE